MAALSAGVLAATGLYLAGRHVQSLSTVSASTYGTAVLAKSLLLAVALGIAAYNTLVVNPALADRVLGRRVAWRPDRRRLATTATVEAAVLVTAVAVAALMTTVPTAKEVARADVLYAPAHATVDGLFVTFEAVPTGPSQRILVRVEPVIRPVADPVTGVQVGIAGPSAPGTAADGAAVVLRKTEEGRYEGSLPAAPDGDWQAQLVLNRVWSDDVVLAVPWSSGTGHPTTGLERATSALALLLLAGMASVLALVAARRRPTTGVLMTDELYLAHDESVPAGQGGPWDAPDAGDGETTAGSRVGASRR
jgi:copper transport protein